MQHSIHLFERLPQIEARPATVNDGAFPPVRSKPLVGLIRNGRSYHNGGGSPVEGPSHNAAVSHGALGEVIVTAPQERSDLVEILADFAARRVDCIAIDGGDGTVRDVLSCGAGIFGESWPTLIVLPHGKTNALALDLGIPVDWTLEQALAAIQNGKIERRQPLVITQKDNSGAQVRGFIMGAGIFNRCIALGQRSHDFGAFNAAVVGLTTAWSVLQAFFGSGNNPWRRGTRMRLRTGEGKEVEHLGGLPADERYLLFASTLKKFPAGLNPFRGLDKTVRVALLDNPGRGLLLRIGALMRGTASAATRRRGGHVFDGEALDLELSGRFILDGESFPAGHYRLNAGAKLRFVVP
ncbi:acylglycerol kinase family protein [Erythrobacter alti]|uniref:diacylglycerol/lipid kinase family protein n=1 Tax=Erythrobacter alti TaxID=1896145 RepID=UPI0030F48581